MNHPLFIYLLESSICLAIFYLFFRLLLQKEPLLQTNRFFILIAVLLSLLIPAIHIPLQEEIILSSPVFLLQEISIKEQPATYRFSVELYVLYVYKFICLCLLLRLLWQTGKLLYFFYTSRSSKSGDYYLVLTEGKLPTFSFFRLLFWDNSEHLTEEQKLQVLQHELAHIRQWHSLDIIFLELVKIFFWFHPAVYLFKQSLQQTHEYLADAVVVKSYNREGYIQLIIAQVFKTSPLTLTNPFSQFKTKHRIMMLQKSTYTKPALWKIALSLPLIAILVLIYSCDTSSEDVQPETELNKASASIANYEDIIKKYKQKYPTISIGVVTLDKPGESPVVFFVVENAENNAVKLRIEQEINQELRNSAKQISKPNPLPQHNGEIYQVAEIQPEPISGVSALMQYIGNNIRYPAEAAANNIEGKVFVQFVIGTDGSVSGVQVLKGIGFGCDEEAIRVVSAMPAWKPGLQKGKPVNVRMSLPIIFKLN